MNEKDFVLDLPYRSVINSNKNYKNLHTADEELDICEINMYKFRKHLFRVHYLSSTEIIHCGMGNTLCNLLYYN